MSTRICRSAAMMAVCAVALAFVACGKSEEEPQVPWDVSKESPPAALPKDLPVYPNAKFEMGVTRHGGVAIWRTPDPVPTVQRYLTEQLKAKGWRVAAYPGVGASWLGDGGVTLVATTWGRRVSLAVATQDGTTAITAVWNGKQS